MRHALSRSLRSTLLLSALFLTLGLGIAAGCDTCPDLALPAMQVTTTGVTDPAAIKVTATVTGTSNVVIDDGALDELQGISGNTYDLDFTADGTDIGSLQAVCTRGYMTGCKAEKYTDADMPEVAITQDGTSFSVSLARQGNCPAD